MTFFKTCAIALAPGSRSQDDIFICRLHETLGRMKGETNCGGISPETQVLILGTVIRRHESTDLEENEQRPSRTMAGVKMRLDSDNPV